MKARLPLLARTAGCLLLMAQAASALCAPATPDPAITATVTAATEAGDVTAVFADALHCRTDFPDAREPAMAERLRAGGVVALDLAPGENLDLLYVFPKPLHIDGTQVFSVAVRGGSGTIVAARAKGDLQAFVRHTQARPRAHSQWDLDGFGELPAQYTRVMPKRPGIDETAPRLVMGRAISDAADAMRWGCRSYDD